MNKTAPNFKSMVLTARTRSYSILGSIDQQIFDDVVENIIDDAGVAGDVRLYATETSTRVISDMMMDARYLFAGN